MLYGSCRASFPDPGETVPGGKKISGFQGELCHESHINLNVFNLLLILCYSCHLFILQKFKPAEERNDKKKKKRSVTTAVEDEIAGGEAALQGWSGQPQAREQLKMYIHQQ